MPDNSRREQAPGNTPNPLEGEERGRLKKQQEDLANRFSVLENGAADLPGKEGPRLIDKLASAKQSFERGRRGLEKGDVLLVRREFMAAEGPLGKMEGVMANLYPKVFPSLKAGEGGGPGPEPEPTPPPEPLPKAEDLPPPPENPDVPPTLSEAERSEWLEAILDDPEMVWSNFKTLRFEQCIVLYKKLLPLLEGEDAGELEQDARKDSRRFSFVKDAFQKLRNQPPADREREVAENILKAVEEQMAWRDRMTASLKSFEDPAEDPVPPQPVPLPPPMPAPEVPPAPGPKPETRDTALAQELDEFLSRRDAENLMRFPGISFRIIAEKLGKWIPEAMQSEAFRQGWFAIHRDQENYGIEDFLAVGQRLLQEVQAAPADEKLRESLADRTERFVRSLRAVLTGDKAGAEAWRVAQPEGPEANREAMDVRAAFEEVQGLYERAENWQEDPYLSGSYIMMSVGYLFAAQKELLVGLKKDFIAVLYPDGRDGEASLNPQVAPEIAADLQGKLEAARAGDARLEKIFKELLREKASWDCFSIKRAAEGWQDASEPLPPGQTHSSAADYLETLTKASMLGKYGSFAPEEKEAFRSLLEEMSDLGPALEPYFKSLENPEGTQRKESISAQNLKEEYAETLAEKFASQSAELIRFDPEFSADGVKVVFRFAKKGFDIVYTGYFALQGGNLKFQNSDVEVSGGVSFFYDTAKADTKKELDPDMDQLSEVIGQLLEKRFPGEKIGPLSLRAGKLEAVVGSLAPQFDASEVTRRLEVIREKAQAARQIMRDTDAKEYKSRVPEDSFDSSDYRFLMRRFDPMLKFLREAGVAIGPEDMPRSKALAKELENNKLYIFNSWSVAGSYHEFLEIREGAQASSRYDTTRKLGPRADGEAVPLPNLTFEEPAAIRENPALHARFLELKEQILSGQAPDEYAEAARNGTLPNLKFGSPREEGIYLHTSGYLESLNQFKNEIENLEPVAETWRKAQRALLADIEPLKDDMEAMRREELFGDNADPDKRLAAARLSADRWRDLEREANTLREVMQMDLKGAVRFVGSITKEDLKQNLTWKKLRWLDPIILKGIREKMLGMDFQRSYLPLREAVAQWEQKKGNN